MSSLHRLTAFCLLSLLLPALHAAEVAPDPTRIRTNAPLAPGANDGVVASVTAQLLERSHYSLRQFNDDVSRKFLAKYIEMLDPQKLHLVQADIDEFQARWGSTLDELTITRRDTSPAYVIFNRFRDRIRLRVAFVNETLPKESFEFNSDERVTVNRKDSPWARNLEAARKLWRERLRYEMLEEKLNNEKPAEIVKILSRRYSRTLRSVEELDGDDVLQIYLTALAHVYDPHSDYMGKATLENFSIGMRLSLFGIGAVLTSEDGYCKIRELSPEGPAQKSKKLKPGDRIVMVAQGTNAPVDVVDMKLNKVVELIRGPKDTEVRLTVIPSDAADTSVRKQVALTRAEIKLEDQAAKARIYDVPTPSGKTQRLGLIDLPSFYSDFDVARGRPERKSTTTDVSLLIKKLKQENVSGLILDLRRNGGGSLEEAINLTGLFIKEGPVVQVRDPDGSVTRDNDTDPGVLYDGPLVVLTSRFSASASEILAGALQDYGRALVVGDISTHGKGTVQSLVQLMPYVLQLAPQLRGDSKFNPGALKVTIRKFYRASGGSTQLEGVKPDLVLPSVNNEAEVGEKSLDNPLEWDTVRPAPYDRLNRVAPFVAELKRLSDVRVAADRDFAYVREDIEQYKKVKAEKSISLNEERRRREKLEAEARTNARKKEIAARKDPDEKVYEITLKLATAPGLPAPLARTNLVAGTGKSGHGTVTQPAKGVTIVTGAAINAPTAAAEAPRKPRGDDDDEATAEAAPSRDVALEETKHILADYIKLLSGAGLVTAAQTGEAAK